MKKVKELKVKIFADGADINEMKKAYKSGLIKGFTTNPTLMNKAGITDYTAFAKLVLKEITDMPISFEVFSDDFKEMKREAEIIASWGKNVNVKIPITNTKGESSVPLIKELSAEGVSLNITAIMTLDQVKDVSKVLNHKVANIISVFAGRIADTGRDPVPMMQKAKEILRNNKNAELLWASPRELLNIFQADDIGCDIITVVPDILKKLSLAGKDLAEYSLETVKMFYNDAMASNFKIRTINDNKKA